MLKNNSSDKNKFEEIIHKTQNYRVTEIGRHLRRSPGPTLLLNQGHLDQIAQKYVQSIFE